MNGLQGFSGLGDDDGAWGAEPITIGPYRVVRRLGAGGMGEVYLARSPGGRPVAVKTFGLGSLVTDDDRRRFAREVALAGRISAAFTAAVVDADPHAELPWMATQFVPAPSLAELVRTCGPLPVEAARWVAAGAAEALAALHAQGIVHRDLKPSNILLPADGPRLIDFGISHTADLTRTTVTLGTVAFASPEQARGERSTPASDVYALGCTVFHLVTGRAPYLEGDQFQLLGRVSRGDVDLTGVPEALADVVRRCLRRDPAERPAATALVEMVRTDLAARPDAASADHWLPPSWLELIRQHEMRDEGEFADGTSERTTVARPFPQPPPGRPTTGPDATTPGTPEGAADPGAPVANVPAGRGARRTSVARVRNAVVAVVCCGALALFLYDGLRGGARDDGQSSSENTSSVLTWTPETESGTQEDEPIPDAAHTEAVAFMDSVDKGDCLNLRYTDVQYVPEGLPRKVACGSSSAATRITRVIRVDPRTLRPLQECPGGADGARWTPFELDSTLDTRSLCVNRVFRVGDCFPVREWVGGRRDQGLGVSMDRTRTGKTFSVWDCGWGHSNNFEHVAEVTSIHPASAGRGVCGTRDAWLVEQDRRLVCTRDIGS
ncbi:hypothetical protein AQ490_19210 [Wenjunlia vitaminophila]|uniref:Protein kinase domain-containing protein n=1 Tax=Wenjunlia vitaminophila TaxID=76728 RepID=A0A0T6LUU1_WENVI|nr:serine/threonine-protein kinase [Wenjunlia vitaminophila]KRV49818.1 hypothetical protein AQ490_19210 [Wenjunlia vitaminophila]